MEVGKRKERVQLGCVLLQPPVANLAEAPLVLDHAKDMFDSGPGPITLAVEGLVRAVKLALPGGLAQYTPSHPACFRLGLSGFAHIALVPVDHLLLPVQTRRHHLRVMHIGCARLHRMHQSLRIRTHMRLHTEMPGVALLRGGHLWIALALLVLG